MLTFEEKLAIIESFPQLKKKEVSLGRLNFHYEGSVCDKKIVIHHLHPNGNGYVYAGHLPKSQTDPKGMVNIRLYSEEALRTLIEDSIRYLSHKPEPAQGAGADKDSTEERWSGPENQLLVLVNEHDLWNVYAGLNLEESFESYKEAEMYLMAEGFRRL